MSWQTYTFKTLLAKRSLALIEAVLKSNPQTINELTSIGMSRASIQKYVAHLHQQGRIHIGGWKTTGKGTRPGAVWMQGKSEDVELEVEPRSQRRREKVASERAARIEKIRPAKRSSNELQAEQ